MNYRAYGIQWTRTNVAVNYTESYKQSGKREFIYIKMMLRLLHLQLRLIIPINLPLLNPLDSLTNRLIYCNWDLFFNRIGRIKLQSFDIRYAKQP